MTPAPSLFGSSPAVAACFKAADGTGVPPALLVYDPKAVRRDAAVTKADVP